MTDSEKLNLILSKITNLEGKFDGREGRFDSLEREVKIIKSDTNELKQKVTGLEKDLFDTKVDLRRMYRDSELILDEVERVHCIWDKHKADRSVYTA